jgi:hypothetical protein
VRNKRNILKVVFDKLFPPKKYGEGWWERTFSEHWSCGRLTIYGFNAMHVAVNLYTKRWGWICFHPPFRVFGIWWPWYFYVSRDATPSSAKIKFGRKGY